MRWELSLMVGHKGSQKCGSKEKQKAVTQPEAVKPIESTFTEEVESMDIEEPSFVIYSSSAQYLRHARKTHASFDHVTASLTRLERANRVYTRVGRMVGSAHAYRLISSSYLSSPHFILPIYIPTDSSLYVRPTASLHPEDSANSECAGDRHAGGSGPPHGNVVRGNASPYHVFAHVPVGSMFNGVELLKVISISLFSQRTLYLTCTFSLSIASPSASELGQNPQESGTSYLSTLSPTIPYIHYLSYSTATTGHTHHLAPLSSNPGTNSSSTVPTSYGSRNQHKNMSTADRRMSMCQHKRSEMRSIGSTSPCPLPTPQVSSTDDQPPPAHLSNEGTHAPIPMHMEVRVGSPCVCVCYSRKFSTLRDRCSHTCMNTVSLPSNWEAEQDKYTKLRIKMLAAVRPLGRINRPDHPITNPSAAVDRLRRHPLPATVDRRKRDRPPNLIRKPDHYSTLALLPPASQIPIYFKQVLIRSNIVFDETAADAGHQQKETTKHKKNFGKGVRKIQSSVETQKVQNPSENYNHRSRRPLTTPTSSRAVVRVLLKASAFEAGQGQT
ncbi:hypothetical protein B0H17DRAFT_1126517 [Mycena rosella]|uniref:Uncharacterized protein n=1 Tax=Mycena rosella TaxID=1033263 RepID=A0AAD7M7X0_MYCRO|nr:hypothetical protein B0H17DRAFT_1126517 [Mycena rosella]